MNLFAFLLKSYKFSSTKKSSFTTTSRSPPTFFLTLSLSFQNFQGTDITEAFETHHLSSKPAELLNNYYISNATDKRNYLYTFDENGFYKTLKQRVIDELKSMDLNVQSKSRHAHDLTLIAFLIMIILVNRVQSSEIYWICVALAAQLLAWLVVMSHNFLHKADNWRMYTANLALMTSRDVRIQHILSHHMYPNSYADLEVTYYEPYYKWLPTHAKGWYYRLVTLLLTPNVHLIYFHNIMRLRWQGIFWGNDRAIFWDEIVMYAVPMVMIIFGGQSPSLDYLYDVFFRWVHIMIFTNFLYVIFNINRGHHAPHLTHQGDEIASYDFGAYQVSTISDRMGANLNNFTVLAYHGEQVLHQLFPTIDHAILPHLKSTLIKTCKEFDVKLNECTIIGGLIGQWRQLYRTEMKILNNNKNE